MLLSQQKPRFSRACVWSRSTLTVWADFSGLGPDGLAVAPALSGVCLEGSAGSSATRSSWQPWKVGKCVNLFNYVLRPLSSHQHHPMSWNGTSFTSRESTQLFPRGFPQRTQWSVARGSLQRTENYHVHVAFLYGLIRCQRSLGWVPVVHPDTTTGSWTSLRRGGTDYIISTLLLSAWRISLQRDWCASKLFGFFLLILFSTGKWFSSLNYDNYFLLLPTPPITLFTFNTPSDAVFIFIWLLWQGVTHVHIYQMIQLCAYNLANTEALGMVKISCCAGRRQFRRIRAH